jgi:hypothetical protein
MHQRRASRSLGVEVPKAMENDKWMVNPKKSSYYEESYITKYQSILNQDMK